MMTNTHDLPAGNSTMIKHLLILVGAAAFGGVAGVMSGVLLKFVAIVSLIGGPGLYDIVLKTADRADVFWLAALSAFGLALCLIYGVWGLVRLIATAFRKTRGGLS